jgi:hypothetical protein
MDQMTTLSEVPAQGQRIDWRMRTMNFIVARLSGPLAEQEAAVDMILAGFDQAHQEGIEDAIDVTERIEAAVTGEQQRMAKVLSKALRELIKRNAATN